MSGQQTAKWIGTSHSIGGKRVKRNVKAGMDRIILFVDGTMIRVGAFDLIEVTW
jgi:hypothetical protein